MTAPTVTQLREAIAAAITADITTARVYTHFPESFTPPALIVQGPDISYNEDTMSDHYVFPVLILISQGYDRVAQLALDSFIDPSSSTSVRLAIENAPTLGSVAQYALVERVYDYGLHEVAGVRYMGAVLDVHVVAYR